MENVSQYITCFGKSHGIPNSLVAMLEKWKNNLDKDENFSALSTDLSNGDYNEYFNVKSSKWCYSDKKQ